ncbi:MAG: MYXO-CTERM sorting domain-containing protein [Sandaracinaceae bacterium]
MSARLTRSSERLAATLGIALFALAPSIALADVPPPDICGELGTACTAPDGQSGHCAVSTCSRINYGPNGPDGTAEYECNRCLPGAPEGQSSNSSCATGRGGPTSLAWLFAAVATFVVRRRRRAE